jgi:hypothetical protein
MQYSSIESQSDDAVFQVTKGPSSSISHGSNLENQFGIPIAHTRPLWRRVFCFLGLLLTTAMSVTLIVFDVTNWEQHEKLPKTISEHQATTQLIIQIIAGILGLIQTSALCEVINTIIRRHLQSHIFTLNTLHFWISVAQKRMDWGVSPKFLVPLVTFVVLTAVPSAL